MSNAKNLVSRLASDMDRKIEGIVSGTPTDSEIVIAARLFGFDNLRADERSRYYVLQEMDKIGTKRISDLLK